MFPDYQQKKIDWIIRQITCLKKSCSCCDGDNPDPSADIVHNNTSGIQGGNPAVGDTPAQRYHLTAAEWAYIVKMVSNDEIGDLFDLVATIIQASIKPHNSFWRIAKGYHYEDDNIVSNEDEDEDEVGDYFAGTKDAKYYSLLRWNGGDRTLLTSYEGVVNYTRLPFNTEPDYL